MVCRGALHSLLGFVPPTWLQVLALPLASCAALGKLLNLSEVTTGLTQEVGVTKTKAHTYVRVSWVMSPLSLQSSGQFLK